MKSLSASELDSLRKSLTEHQDVPAIQLTKTIGVSHYTINKYRQLWNLPYHEMKPCACGCGKKFQAKGCQKYTPECGRRIAKEQRRRNRKKYAHKGPIHYFRPPATGRTIPCLDCGQLFLSTNKAHRICDNCKLSEEWGNGGIVQCGFGRVQSRASVGGAA